MSIFKTSGIVLKINKIGPKDFIYTIFSSDFGKIRANKKLSTREKTLDLGYLINFEIETKKNSEIHKIRNIKIKSEFLNKKRTFSEINNYLLLLNSIFRKIPDGVASIEIFEIVKKVNILNPISQREKVLATVEINLILANLKIINISGELKLENKNKTVYKILNFIHNSKIESIFKLTGIDEETKRELEALI